MNRVISAKGNPVSGKSAFTLIELLIVVAIIAILAAIAVPNFLEAQVRAKVARVQADMRTMTTAIESYTVDNNKPPVRRDKWEEPNTLPGNYLPAGNDKVYASGNPQARVGLHTLTTPISYLASIPADVFNVPGERLSHTLPGYSSSLEYWDPKQLKAFLALINGLPLSRIPENGYALHSVGPDQYIGGLGTRADYPAEDNVRIRNTMRYLYDPTNGSVSYGNVYRFSASLQQKDIYPL